MPITTCTQQGLLQISMIHTVSSYVFVTRLPYTQYLVLIVLSAAEKTLSRGTPGKADNLVESDRVGRKHAAQHSKTMMSEQTASISFFSAG